MWEIYDRLIAGIPADWTAEEIVRGSSLTYVRSRNCIGISEPRNYDFRKPEFTRNLEGAPLREVAECIKSWNFYEASIGHAAINAYYNHIDIARDAGVAIDASQHIEDRVYDPFIMGQHEVRGKTVTVIGHFPYISKLFEPICDLKIIAGEIPEEDDYPFSAVEYLIPKSEMVFVSSSTFVDKTLPRVLELAKNAGKVTIVGPSTTLTPLLFSYGVKDLSGFVVKNSERAMRLIKGAEHGKIFSTGQKVAFRKT